LTLVDIINYVADTFDDVLYARERLPMIELDFDARAEATAPTIRDLLSYRLHRLSSLISRSAAMRYRGSFDVSLGEWRVIALLGAHAPLSLNELAKAADLDKGQASRVVTGLVGRGLARKKADASDSRAIDLTLTRAGERLYGGLMRAARSRNAHLLEALTKEERRLLERVLRKLEAEARALIRAEDETLATAATRAGRDRAPRLALR
jgi:DNA-binding MarR family transcriptional regulator